MTINALPYQYRHMPIGGGGYVTGFIFHPSDPNVMYCRTDIGGVYRFDYATQQWISLIDHISYTDLRETCPISVALDAQHPERLYIASGLWEPDTTGKLTVSHDFGQTFRHYELPVYVHGNLHGRGAGERLLCEGETLWLASQKDGLWCSPDAGATWQRVETFPETGCTFIARIGRMLLVGTEGLACRSGDMRGNSLYASWDNGATFTPVAQLEYIPVEGSQLHGLVAQRCSFDGEYLYVSFSANGARSQNIERGYTCDSGDCSCGRIARYPFDAGSTDGSKALGSPEDITPEKGNWGFSSIDAKHGMLITATIHRQHQDGDAVYISRDQGSTWTTVLHALHTGRMDFRLSYMKPEYNGGNIIHWLTDVKIDPHRPNTAWFNTGTGTFRTQTLQEDPIVWSDWCDGMEETVHINVHAPAAGRVKVVDIIGDLGGFAFTDVDKHCENSFADDQGNRWITCLSCDWPDANPDNIVVTARGNWTGKTKGGLIVTEDGAQTWTRIPTPSGLGDELDALLLHIEKPNINAGWVAMSADAQTYVWAVAEGILLHAKNLIVTHDQGRTFRNCAVLNRDGQSVSGLMKPLADRCMPHIFYGFGDKGELYISTDGGSTFREKAAPAGFPEANFGLVDCADRTEIRVASGQPGDIYLATGEGLWKLHYDPAADEFTGTRLTKKTDRAFCLGLGLGREGGNYANEPKMLYFNGIIDGQYGFYRSPDEGRTITRINNDRQMFGDIQSIDGDKRVFGRFFLATGSSGLVYGHEEERR